MQPFDALAMRAVLQEAAPLLLNRRVDSVSQVGRDEILLVFRGRGGEICFRVCAHASYGRVCLVKSDTNRKVGSKSSELRTSFSTLLKKGLAGATLIALEQTKGERILDLIFSCVDEVGSAVIKTITAEIMGRHSNIIFWQRSDQSIISSSHAVTKEMSRHREVLPGLKYIRPPGQTRTSVFEVERDQFNDRFDEHVQAGDDRISFLTAVENWLSSYFCGLGKNLVEEISRTALSDDGLPAKPEEVKNRLWECLLKVQGATEFKPAMKNDLSRYTVLDLNGSASEENGWQVLPAVNDLIEQFYSAVEAKLQFRQEKERLLKEVLGEADKLTARLKALTQGFDGAVSLEQGKLFGDLILANLPAITSGQGELVCQNIFADGSESLVIPLNVNLTAVQNAQNYYRHYAKARNRARTIELSQREGDGRLRTLLNRKAQIEEARSLDELSAMKHGAQAQLPKKISEAQPPKGKDKGKQRLLTITSSDGWLIYVGRNRKENDHLIGRISQPKDIWFHILGQSGAHVLIKVPSSKMLPPLTTIKEAAFLAARFSRIARGAKARVVYTEVRFVKRLGNGKSGMVHYENEKTIEVDTDASLPKVMKQLFA